MLLVVTGWCWGGRPRRRRNSADGSRPNLFAFELFIFGAKTLFELCCQPFHSGKRQVESAAGPRTREHTSDTRDLHSISYVESNALLKKVPVTLVKVSFRGPCLKLWLEFWPSSGQWLLFRTCDTVILLSFPYLLFALSEISWVRTPKLTKSSFSTQCDS